jgi:hypothetical protein
MFRPESNVHPPLSSAWKAITLAQDPRKRQLLCSCSQLGDPLQELVKDFKIFSRKVPFLGKLMGLGYFRHLMKSVKRCQAVRTFC